MSNVVAKVSVTGSIYAILLTQSPILSNVCWLTAGSHSCKYGERPVVHYVAISQTTRWQKGEKGWGEARKRHSRVGGYREDEEEL